MKPYRLLFLVLILACSFSVASRELNAEKEFRSAEEMKAWVQNQRGFGPFQSYEIRVSGARVFVGWSDPYSGRSVDHVYAYSFDEDQGKWKLIDATAFEQGPLLSHPYVDKNERLLIYVDRKGKKFKKISLDADR